MKKLLTTALAALMLTTTALPAMALEYEVGEPEAGVFAPSSSVEQVTVVGAASKERDNIDRSKSAAVVPPAFGSPESNQTGTGTVLIPQTGSTSSAPATASSSGSTTVSNAGVLGDIYIPPAVLEDSPAADVVSSANKFTLPDGLYYSDGSLGLLKIPSLGLSVKVYEDESLESLAKGAGHFKSTSCWDGNVGIAGHNRGVTNHFGQIHTLKAGDKIVYTTQLGTRTYEVYYVGQISYTDFSHLDRTSDNIITLITCVQNVPTMRWCVQAKEIS